MVSPRAELALAAVVVVGILALLAVGTTVLPNPLAPQPIQGTPEPFSTTTGDAGGATTFVETTATTVGSAISPAGTANAPTGSTHSPTDGSTATQPRTATTRRRPPRSTVNTQLTHETATATSGIETTVETERSAGMNSTPTAGSTPTDRRYERARVTLLDTNGTRLATVQTWIADTEKKRYTGLSNTGSLENGTGMLFVYDHEQHLTYVMRRMDYPLDIVFIGTDRRINRIRSAKAPDPGEDGNHIRRSGSGKWVLEVPRGWMARNGIEEGDRIAINRSS